MKPLVIATLGLLLTQPLIGCQKQKPAPAPQSSYQQPQAPADLEHTIRHSGETLAVMAAWYTGRAQNWMSIRDANPGVRPERLRLGQVIRIPGSLLTRSEPLPKEFIRKFMGSNDGAKSSKASMAPVENAPTAVTGTAPAAAEKQAETEAPQAVAAPAESAPAAAPVAPAVAEPAPAEQPPAPVDAEREQLLDDLLSNP